jgi:hypothetical protein
VASFDFLIEYARRINARSPVEKLPRTPDVEKQYDAHKRKYPDLHKHIMETYLSDCDYCLVPNRFPLAVQKNIDHFVLWIKDPRATLDIDAYLKTKFEGKRMVVYENPEEWKSIPLIKHYQIFVDNS